MSRRNADLEGARLGESETWRTGEWENWRGGDMETWKMRGRRKGGHHDPEPPIRFHGVIDTMQ
jgi:hypothetical protein